MRTPMVCRMEAYQYFAAQLPHLNSDTGLFRAALALSMHALDDFKPEQVERQIDDLTARVVGNINVRCTGSQQSALLARLHEVLFVEEEFHGNEQDYYNPMNSFMPYVLATKSGIPISLSLLYKVVGSRAGLTIQGVNAPGHFLCRVFSDRHWLWIDPYHGGRAFSREEAFDHIDAKVGRPQPRTDKTLAPATHQQWIGRMINNLQSLMVLGDCRTDLAAMTELHKLLDGSPF